MSKALLQIATRYKKPYEQEAATVVGMDSEIHQRDIYEAIKKASYQNGKYKLKIYIQVIQRKKPIL